MRKLLTLLISLAAITFGGWSPASAQLGMTGVGGGSDAPGSGSITITALANPAPQTSGTSSTFSVNLGAGTSGRIIVICIGVNGAGAAISGVTLAGNAMTQAAQTALGGNTRLAAMFYIVDAISNVGASIVIFQFSNPQYKWNYCLRDNGRFIFDTDLRWHR